MNQILLTIFGVIATGAAAFIAYRYRNKITYEVTTITSEVYAKYEEIHSSKDHNISLVPIMGYPKKLNSERLELANRGFRSLRDVELHLPLKGKPYSLQIVEIKTLSKEAIATEWNAGSLKIRIPTFPPEEKMTFEFLSVGWYENERRAIRGTGGQYKIVSKGRYELMQSFVRNIGWVFALSLVCGLVVFNILNVAIVREQPHPPVSINTH